MKNKYPLPIAVREIELRARSLGVLPFDKHLNRRAENIQYSDYTDFTDRQFKYLFNHLLKVHVLDNAQEIERRARELNVLPVDKQLNRHAGNVEYHKYIDLPDEELKNLFDILFSDCIEDKKEEDL